MSFRKTFICLLSLVYFCTPATILDLEFPYKCSINDGECMKNLITVSMEKYRRQGLPELGIPISDPYHVKNATVSVLNMIDFIMTDGLVEGTTSCSLKKFESIFNDEEKYISSETFCERFKISGRYKTEFGSLAQSLIGNTIYADGEGLIQIDKMILKMMIPYEVKKHEDGEIYLIPNVSEAEYSTNDIENITFNATNVILGGRDISERLINFMNSNWKMINSSFGKMFSDKVMETYYSYLMKYFSMVPASKYITDDLTPHVTIKKYKKRVYNEIVN